MPSLIPGTLVVERYRVLTALPPWYGGAVLARDERLGQSVDLTLAPAACGTPLGAFFTRRAQVIGTLQHVAIPLVCDVAAHEGYPLLVHRHVDGRPLGHILDDERLALTTIAALRLVAQVAQALGLAHAQGVCHGMLSAESIHLDAQGNAVLGDLAWPYRASSGLPAASPYIDVAALSRLAALVLDATAGARSAALQAELEGLVQRTVALRANACLLTGTEVSQAIAQLVARLESAKDGLAIARVPAAPPYVPAWQTARPVSRTRPAPRPMRSTLRPRTPVAGGAHPWAVALLIGLALMLLPGLESVAHHRYWMGRFGGGSAYQQAPMARPWGHDPFSRRTWGNPSSQTGR